LILIAAASFAWGGASTAAAGGVDAPDTSKEKTTRGEQDGRRTLRRLPANFGRGILGVFHRDTLLPLVVGGVATGGAFVLDQEMRDWISPDPGEGWGSTVSTSGGLWSSVFVAGMFTAGRVSKHTRFRAVTYDWLDASMMNVVYFQSLKFIVGRERPNGSNNQSFPSGHTSNAFALATVTERHYGWKVGVPAYLLAGLVGAARMKEDAHYFSDVVAGATLGYIVGRTVVRVNNRPLEDGAHKGAFLNLAPMVGPHERGMQLSLTF
jgi:membrane-associated phospholipid phosphatase